MKTSGSKVVRLRAWLLAFFGALLLSGHAVAVDSVSREQSIKALDAEVGAAVNCYIQFMEVPPTNDLQAWARESMRRWGMVADAIVMNGDHVALRALLNAYMPPEGGSGRGGFPLVLEEKYKRALQSPPQSRQAVMDSMAVLTAPYGEKRDALDAAIAFAKLAMILARASGCEIDEALKVALSKAEQTFNGSSAPR